jgi:arylsulfatase A
LDFIRKHKDEPFFVYNPLILPHNPFPVTPHSKDPEETDNKKNFIDMVQYIDFLVGRIVDTLEELGLRENTLILFTGDNGTNHVLSSELNGKDIPGGKGFTHDYGTHVPLIVNLPGRIPEGQVNDDLIAFSDFFPTMIEASGIAPKQISNTDGISFWPQCLGHDGTKRESIFGYYFPRPYSKKFDDMYNHWEVRYARDERFKLYGDGRFYDTKEDVMEQNPIPSHNESESVSRARTRLQGTLDSFPTQGAMIDYQRVTGELPKTLN